LKNNQNRPYKGLGDIMIDEEYYQFYLSKHQSRENRYWHLIGNVMTIIYIIAIISTASLWWLLLSPFVVYPFAFFGHWMYCDNEPALLSSNPIKAKLADIRMSWETLIGKL
jgi:hypothetical protein